MILKSHQILTPKRTPKRVSGILTDHLILGGSVGSVPLARSLKTKRPWGKSPRGDTLSGSTSKPICSPAPSPARGGGGGREVWKPAVPLGDLPEGRGPLSQALELCGEARESFQKACSATASLGARGQKKM
ncbi:hypothetical protein VULLAG_LOCUS136 [Vulpes lagopus]